MATRRSSAADSGKTHFAVQNGSENRSKVQSNQLVDDDLGRTADSRNSALQIAVGSRTAADFAGEFASPFCRAKYPINN
jgi:hypothetical protein